MRTVAAPVAPLEEPGEQHGAGRDEQQQAGRQVRRLLQVPAALPHQDGRKQAVQEPGTVLVACPSRALSDKVRAWCLCQQGYLNFPVMPQRHSSSGARLAVAGTPVVIHSSSTRRCCNVLHAHQLRVCFICARLVSEH